MKVALSVSSPQLHYWREEKGLVIGRVCSVNNFGAFAGEKQKNFMRLFFYGTGFLFWHLCGIQVPLSLGIGFFMLFYRSESCCLVAYLCFLVVSVP